MLILAALPAMLLGCGDERALLDAELSLDDPSTLGEALTGTDVVLARHVAGLNDQRTGRFGFSELARDASTPSDQHLVSGTTNTGRLRAQLSPDGLLWIRYNSDRRWEIAPTRPLSVGVRLEGSAVSGFELDDTLGPSMKSGDSKFIDDTRAFPHIQPNFGLGHQLAIAFNPLFATRGIPVEEADLATCDVDRKPKFSPRDDARYECLHLLVYQRGHHDELCNAAENPLTPCLMVAPLVVQLDRSTPRAPTITRARIGKFRLLQMLGGPVHQTINEFASTADGSLIFYVAGTAASEDDDAATGISYSFNPRPYLPIATSPDWASVDWTPARPIWGLYEDALVDDNVVRGVRGGFGRAYPMAQYPFRFGDGVRIRGGTGKYQWFTPEGTGMFLNMGNRAVSAELGRETRGVVKHLDTAAQLTHTHYCYAIDPDEGEDCDPLVSDAGNARCSARRQCNGRELGRIGVQEYTSFGTTSGVWAARDTPVGSTLLPFQRRFPSRYMLFNQKALAYFNQDTSARGQHMWLLDAIADDDFDDRHFLAFFHMNEGILGDVRSAGCDDGAGGAACDINVQVPFTNREQESPVAFDTSQTGAVGELLGGAQFPYDYWRAQGIGERVQGNPEGTGEVNPGYRGRAVRFPPGGSIQVSADPSGRLSSARRQLTVELAIRHEARSALTAYQGVLVAQPGSWRFSFVDGRLRFGDDQLFVLSGPLSLDADRWHHLAVTAEPEGTSLRVAFYLDGILQGSPQRLALDGLRAVSSTTKLCIGPGCGSSASARAVWLDEVAISDVKRPLAYLRSAANAEHTAPGFNAARAQRDWPALAGPLPLGLKASDLRVPNALLDVFARAPSPQKRYTAVRALGRALFHDELLSSSSSTADRGRACSSCHAEAAGFASPAHARRDAALGAPGRLLPLHTPTVLNRAFSIRQFSDERAADVLEQATGPITNPAEMGGELNAILSRINGVGASAAEPGRSAGPFVNVVGNIAPPRGVRTYKQWFCLAFKGTQSCADTFTREHLKLALATYELSLFRGGSDVDRMRTGEQVTDAVSVGRYTMSLRRGFEVFSGKGRCLGCHSGSNYSDELTHMSGPLGQDGAPVTMKTPTLRGLVDTFPYFHDGQNGGSLHPSWCQYPASDAAGDALCRVVAFYDKGACRMADTIQVRANSTAKDMQPLVVDDVSCDVESVSLGLSEQESRDLVEFLRHL